jgi:uncharacterized repeat protein (TIGR03803 family)
VSGLRKHLTQPAIALAIVFLFCRMAIAAPAQTFTTLVNFGNSAFPEASLVQGRDGNLYGTTFNDPNNPNRLGTVFRMTPSGSLTTIYSFCSQTNCTDGAWPAAGLVLATDGNFYGTTTRGGTSFSGGTVFKITPAGKLTTIYSFCTQVGCPDGAVPMAALIQAIDGSLYGTTLSGGSTCGFPDNSCGVVFKITLDGKLTTLHTFCDQTACPDGRNPYSSLIQAADGNFYGTTFSGGTKRNGVIFKITPAGKFAVVLRFAGFQGSESAAGLIQATSGDLYGTVVRGGAHDAGAVFSATTLGGYTKLYDFCALQYCRDGQYPRAGLVQASDGNFYGAAYLGGTAGRGTLFKVTSGGKFTRLHTFRGPDGNGPPAALLQATDGSFYGVTDSGGSGNGGTVFRLSAGLGPFVRTVTASGELGATVEILGTNLTAATAVSFNGTRAAFTVVSSTEIRATVPAGATTGPVIVTTPGGSLTSNRRFLVIHR